MESVASMASFLPSKLLLLLLSPIDSSPPALSLPSIVPDRNCFNLLHFIRYFLLLALHSLLFIARIFLAPALNLTLAALDSSPSFPDPNPAAAAAPRLPWNKNSPSVPTREGDTGIARALSHVLTVMTQIPVGSRKYEMVRALAERLIDDNLRCGREELEEVNRAVLSVAFSRTLRRLEASMASHGRTGMADRQVGRILSRLRRWAEVEEEAAEDVGWSGGSSWAEKLAAELTWLADKMAACGVAGEAVARWGSASGLARLALSAEPRLQGAFVRLSAFLFRYANTKNMERWEGEREGEEEGRVARLRMEMLLSWLPLLCRASNGIDAPVMNSLEKSEMVSVLENIIEKLSEDQQEEVLALWLHHFTYCPDSDWPNLQSCYTRWYAKSQKLLLAK